MIFSRRKFAKSATFTHKHAQRVAERAARSPSLDTILVESGSAGYLTTKSVEENGHIIMYDEEKILSDDRSVTKYSRRKAAQFTKEKIEQELLSESQYFEKKELERQLEKVELEKEEHTQDSLEQQTEDFEELERKEQLIMAKLENIEIKEELEIEGEIRKKKKRKDTASEEELREEQIGINFDSLCEKVQDKETGFDLQDRKYHFKTYTECFVGNEAVDWLMTKLSLDSRPYAVNIASLIMRRGIFEHVVDKNKDFVDGHIFYKFVIKKKVVIVGGGFAGSRVAKLLSRDYAVTLVDNKSYFISTPSLPICVCNPKHFHKIISQHQHYLPCRVVTVGASEVTESDVELEDGRSLQFDYLVICTGSYYKTPMIKDECTIPVINPLLFTDDLEMNYQKVKKARKIVVIGGGPVGIEIAAEIISHFPDKKLTIVYSRDTTLERCCAGADATVVKFFKNYENVKLLPQTKVVSITRDRLLTDSGQQIRADMVYCCVGFSPNNLCLQNIYFEGLGVLDSRGYVRVNDHLQLLGYDNIFAAGDIVNIEEEKLAQNAESHAEVVAANIKALDKGEPMIPYEPKLKYLCISLGKSAMLVKGDDVLFEGRVASKVKELVEFKIMRGINEKV